MPPCRTRRPAGVPHPQVAAGQGSGRALETGVLRHAVLQLTAVNTTRRAPGRHQSKLRKSQGLMIKAPVSAKSATLRVATEAPRETAIAAICASN